jgi:hypothetical protein
VNSFSGDRERLRSPGAERTVRSSISSRRRFNDGLRLSMTKNAHRKQRAGLQTRALTAPAPNAAQLEKMRLNVK